MHEEAQKILDYLPIRRNAAENEYINHLLSVFNVLDTSDAVARSFALMPFHLLFMLALQYKILRVFKESSRDYNLSFTIKNLRDDQKAVLEPASPLVIGSLNESEIADLCKLIGLGREYVGEIKGLIRNRNDTIAHARGGIERDIDGKINKYLAALEAIQVCMRSFNDRIASNWFGEIAEEDGFYDFVDIRLLDALLCPADFASGILSLFALNDEPPFEDWRKGVLQALESGSPNAVIWIKTIAIDHNDSQKRYCAIELLAGSGNLDDFFKKLLLENEKDPGVLALLNAE